jgi:hypothetical protein
VSPKPKPSPLLVPTLPLPDAPPLLYAAARACALVEEASALASVGLASGDLEVRSLLRLELPLPRAAVPLTARRRWWCCCSIRCLRSPLLGR